MKTGKWAMIILSTILLVSMPAVADARGAFGGGLILGLGAGLITGLVLAPTPVYVAPPAYYAPPPPAVYPYYPSYVPAPVPPNPAVSDYSNSAARSSACRAIRMPGMEIDGSALGKAVGPELRNLAKRPGGKMGMGWSAMP